ncbi:YicC/YloC family endoribonuclease [Ovoidimarina sediminis]|uniref:YicC/YloC family endoribonuclease n=1 Tax=Ovoidimarina sediminis TaxID=3079856 RepID=UPI002908294B|nr:YicC/YloC family endoribonuclease [Rhodophyticola sp. MJ-SS7]MDU8941929.1 YicC/YloC family endoribonuclease [Rhodophyticola sp. MJ-SS7]
MTHSMTGYATRDGAGEGWRWTWELRSVNGRGLDLRLRLPDWPGEIEPQVRAALSKAAQRGNVTCALRLTRADAEGVATLNAAALTTVLSTLREIEVRAEEAGLTLVHPTAADIATMRGVLTADAGEEADPAPLRAAILADLPPLIEAFTEMRASEGAALESVLRGQIDAVEKTTHAARALLKTRGEAMEQSFRDALAKILSRTEGMDEARIAQELAVLAVKADVTEELDRLDAHVAAARELLDLKGAKGRKLDFLCQEFNREANTLCSKAGFPDLTRLGLDLKHTIDQMREQIQNLE